MRAIKAILILLLLQMAYCATAQQSDEDSLRKVIAKKTIKDTAYVNLLMQLGRKQIDVDNDALRKTADEILQISQQLHFDKGIGYAYNYKGVAADIDAKYPAALEYYNTALEYAKKAQLEKLESGLYSNLGLIKYKFGAYEEALNLFFKALKIGERIGIHQANITNNISLAYKDMQNYAEAIKWAKRSIQYREKDNSQAQLAASYNNLAAIYALISNRDSVFLYINKALAIQEKINDKYGLGISYQGLAEYAYQYDNNHEKAIQYFDKSLALREELGDSLGLNFLHERIALLHYNAHQYEKAKTHVNIALQIAERLHLTNKMAMSYKILSNIYKDQKNYPAAYAALNKYVVYNDSALSEEMTQKLSEMSIKYDVEKKDLELSNTKNKLEANALKLKQKDYWLYGSIALFILLSLLGISYYRRYRLVQEKRLQMEVIKQQDNAAKAIISAEENERARMSATLHDGLGQILSVVKMNLQSMHPMLINNEKSQKTYHTTFQLVDNAIEEMRNVSKSILPNMVIRTGLANALKEMIEQMDTPSLEIQLQMRDIDNDIEENIQLVLYRIFQESINNVIKHAHASKLRIELWRDEQDIFAIIQDNGLGFSIDKPSNGIGLDNIRNRVQFLKGQMNINSSPNAGTTLSFKVPYERNPNQ